MLPTVQLAWHHLCLQIPPAWEVVAFKNDPRDARLVLSDRHGETLHVYAKPFPKKPGITRRLADLVETGCETDMTARRIRKQITDVRGWRTFLPEDDSLPIFAGRYVEDSGILIHLTFPPHPDSTDRRLVDRVLASFEPNVGPERQWAVFGIEAVLPEAMELRRLDPFPAAQVLQFENRRGESVQLHRYGMMPLLLGGADMATFYARVKGRRTLLRSEGAFQKDGKYSGMRLAYTTRGKGGFDVLLARTWWGKVFVWRRDDLKRLCCAENHAPLKHLIEDLPDRVRCR